jgi:hypothetical protein
MIGLCVSFFKALRQEAIPTPEPRPVVTIPDAAAPRPRPGVAGGK